MESILFKDKSARLISFHIVPTFDGYLEGHPMLMSWSVLRKDWERMKREKDFILLLDRKIASLDTLEAKEEFYKDEQEWYYSNKDIIRQYQPNNHECISPFIVLGCNSITACFEAFDGDDYLQYLTLQWYEKTIDVTLPLKEIVEQKTSKIESCRHCSSCQNCDM